MSRLRKRSQTNSEGLASNGFGSPLHAGNPDDPKLSHHLEPRIQRKLENFRNLYEELLRIREKPYGKSSLDVVTVLIFSDLESMEVDFFPCWDIVLYLTFGGCKILRSITKSKFTSLY